MSAFDDLPQPFVRADVVAAQLSPRAIGRAVAAGTLLAVGKRLYAVRESWEEHPPWVQHRLLSGAAARLTKDAIVSHASDAALLGLPYPPHPPQVVSMTLLDDTRTSRSDCWRRFHRGSTPYEHVEIRDGVPRFVTSRTVLDCARELHARDALAIADGALRSGLVTYGELLAMRRHQRRWPGIRNSNEVLMLADGRRENWLESASAWAAHRWGLPVAIPQVNVLTPQGQFVGRGDFLWAEHGIIGEADGVEKYLLGDGTPASVLKRLEAEGTRQSGFMSLGVNVVRWSPAEAVDGAEIHSRFCGALRDLSAAPLTAVFRCSCCDREPSHCAVEAQLTLWRSMLTEEFAPKVW